MGSQGITTISMHMSMLCVKTGIGTIVPFIYLLHIDSIGRSHFNTYVNTLTPTGTPSNSRNCFLTFIHGDITISTDDQK